MVWKKITLLSLNTNDFYLCYFLGVSSASLEHLHFLVHVWRVQPSRTISLTIFSFLPNTIKDLETLTFQKKKKFYKLFTLVYRAPPLPINIPKRKLLVAPPRRFWALALHS